MPAIVRKEPFLGPLCDAPKRELPSTGLEILQSNGRPPDVILSAHAPGRHGASIVHLRFARGFHINGTSLHHTIILRRREARTATTINGRSEINLAKAGTHLLCPAEAAYRGDGEEPNEGLGILIPKDAVAFAAAERARAGAGVVERHNGTDPVLVRYGNLLSRHVTDDFVDDLLAWHELTDAVVHRIVDAHLSEVPKPGRAQLSPTALRRAIECIHANFDRPLGVAELADAAEHSRTSFTRLFHRAVGISPYNYVVRVRIGRALKMLATPHSTIADVALQTGFADQSHLCRWVRRMYGTQPSRFAGHPGFVPNLL